MEALNTLYVQTQGTHCRLDGGSIQVIGPEGAKTRLPLARLDAIHLFGRVTISAPLIAQCAEDGRAVYWLSRSGAFRARVDGPLTGSVHTRLGQARLHDDPERRLDLARLFVAAKIRNSRFVMGRLSRNGQADGLGIADELGGLLAKVWEVSTLDELRGVEGLAARRYFAKLFEIGGRRVTGSLGTPRIRERRPCQDPLNATLSFGYGLLRQQCSGALEAVGLDPQVGVLHSVRAGRPSLALDLMEEFRGLAVDRMVLGLFGNRRLPESCFERVGEIEVRLSEEGRRTLLNEWQTRKEAATAHPMSRSPVQFGLIPHLQARLLARYMSGAAPAYLPFVVAK